MRAIPSLVGWLLPVLKVIPWNATSGAAAGVVGGGALAVVAVGRVVVVVVVVVVAIAVVVGARVVGVGSGVASARLSSTCRTPVRLRTASCTRAGSSPAGRVPRSCTSR